MLTLNGNYLAALQSFAPPKARVTPTLAPVRGPVLNLGGVANLPGVQPPPPLWIESGVAWAIPPTGPSYPVAFATQQIFFDSLSKWLGPSMIPVPSEYYPAPFTSSDVPAIYSTSGAYGTFGDAQWVMGCTPSALPFSTMIVPYVAQLSFLRTFGRTYHFTAPPGMGPAYPGLGSTVTAPSSNGPITMNVNCVLLVPNAGAPALFSFFAVGVGGLG